MGRLPSVVAMMTPAAAALASSAACIATASSWWAAVRRACATSEQDRPNPKALRPRAIDATSSVNNPTAEVHRDAQRALIASGIFRKANPDVVVALSRGTRPVCFPPGHVVFAQGDPGGCLYMIVSGRVKVAYRHIDGGEIVLNLVGASDMFGELTLFDCGTREVTATAVTEVCAMAIERDQMLAWMAECPEIIHQMMRLLARHADVTDELSGRLRSRRSVVSRCQAADGIGQAIWKKRRRRGAGDARPDVGRDRAICRCSAGEPSTQRCGISRIGGGSASRTTVWKSSMGRGWPLFPHGGTISGGEL